jgi:hypothetical protein
LAWSLDIKANNRVWLESCFLLAFLNISRIIFEVMLKALRGFLDFFEQRIYVKFYFRFSIFEAFINIPIKL